MPTSILDSTKKTLGLDFDYDVFDQDVVMFINSAFSTLNQLGVGPEGGFRVVNEQDLWEEINLPQEQLHMVQTYVYLRVKFLFDPPSTSYLITAVKEQIEEHEWRLRDLQEFRQYKEDHEDV